MGFIATSLDIKKLAYKLRRKKGLPPADQIVVRDMERATAQDLAPYVYERLYLPIIRTEKIPLDGLDLALVTDEDIDLLTNVLGNSKAHEYIVLGVVFSDMAPAAVKQSTFI